MKKVAVALLVIVPAISKRSVFATALLTALALLSGNVNADILVSDFDDGTLQGWTEGDPFGQGFNGDLFASAVGGNPGGYMSAIDTLVGGGGLWAKAPITSPLSGDLSVFAGLRWDERVPGNAVLGTGLLFDSAGGTRYEVIRPLTLPGVWHTVFVPFDARAWTLIHGVEAFEDAIMNVDMFFIQLDVQQVLFGEEARVDNIILVPEPATLAVLLVGGVAYSRRRRRSETR